VFYFFILVLALPVWAYEKEETQRTKLPSSPIQVYESRDSEEHLIQTQERDDAVSAEKEKQQNLPVIIIREQPPVQVYSEPLTPQEKLSKARKQAEQQTEDKIRTRLELLRLKDEKARMDKVLDPLEDKDVSVPESAKPAPVQEKASEPFQKSHRFFGHFGIGHLYHHTRRASYSKPIERRGYLYVGGAGLYESNISIEYTFNFSKHRVNYPQTYPRHTLFNLYSHSIAFKYYVSSGRLKPFIGLTGSLNIRKYTTDIADYYSHPPTYYWDQRSSSAFQGGATAGAELWISQKFVAGLEFRWSLSIYSLKDIGTEKESYYSNYLGEQPEPEDMSLYGIQGFFRILF